MGSVTLQIAVKEEDLPIFTSLFEKFEVKAVAIPDIVYSLTKDDLQNVANDVLSRDLTEKELALLENEIGNYIDWYGSIENAILSNVENKQPYGNH